MSIRAISIALVSTAADGTPGNGAQEPVFSPDGTKVAFDSFASNLVPGDTNGISDIFVKDLTTGAITLISTAADGTQGNDGAGGAVFSPDGGKIAFESSASNLVAGDTNGAPDIFLKDLTTGEVTRVSTAADGIQANASSYGVEFSPDGASLMFTSLASNLVPNATNNTFTLDAFIKNLATGAISLAAAAVDGTGNFSPDGTKIAFASYDPNLVAGDTNGATDTFLKDLTTGAVTRISTAADGTQANGRSSDPVFSPDGTKIAFVSLASNLVPGDTNGAADIFLKDLTTGAVTRVSTAADGTQANGVYGSSTPTFSPDGKLIAFSSDASNLVPGDTNVSFDDFNNPYGAFDIFVKNLLTGSITRVSTAADGTQGNDSSWAPVFSHHGSKLLFVSDASNLVPGGTHGRGVYAVTLGSDSFGLTGDFNGDGKVDLLWQNDSGQPGVWLLNGTTPITGTNVGPNPGPSWHIKGAGDFDGSGKSDILWQNDSGQPGVWLMNSTTPITSTNVGPNPGPSWQVTGAGDFDGDHKSDILWQKDDGSAGIWLMNGANVVSATNVGPNPGPAWHVKGTGDFNGDGKSDILWQNADGSAGLWLMDGTTLVLGTNVGPNPGPAWHAIGAGDFNGDGKADILWQNDSGQIGIWLMNSTTPIAATNVGPNPGPSWHVTGVGDFDGDGKADVLWQNDNGQADVWLMDGTNLVSVTNVGGNPGTAWHIDWT